MNKHQYLQLMGVDVWRKRQPRQSVSEPVAAEAEIEPQQSRDDALAQVRAIRPEVSPAAGSTKSNEQTNPVAEAPATSFLLVFVDFPGLSMAGIYSVDFAAAPPEHQRFLSSLYYGLSGTKTVPKFQEFRWPMVKSSRISQTRDEAVQVLSQHLKNRAQHILAFGEAAEMLGVSGSSAYARVLHGDHDITVLPNVDDYFKQAGERRVLWQRLSPLRQTLRQNLKAQLEGTT